MLLQSRGVGGHKWVKISPRIVVEWPQTEKRAILSEIRSYSPKIARGEISFKCVSPICRKYIKYIVLIFLIIHCIGREFTFFIGEVAQTNQLPFQFANIFSVMYL